MGGSKRIASALGVAIAPLLAVSLAAAQPIESNVGCVEGAITNMGYGQYGSGCAISPTADTDQFGFCGSAGDVIQLVAAGADGSLDLGIELFGASPTAIAESSCNSIGTSRCAAVLNTTLPETGCYAAVISDPQSDNVGAYVFEVERLFPPSNPYPIALGQAQNSTLNPISDSDFYSFPVSAGSNIRLVVSGDDGSLDLRVRLLDASGAEVAMQSCDAIGSGTCSVSIDYSVPEPGGAHQILVEEPQHDATGRFSISLTCLSGTCLIPTTTTTTTTTTLATTATSTTSTTTLPGECVGVPSDATFASIECRLAALVAAVSVAPDLGKLQQKLDAMARAAQDRSITANAACNDGKVKPAGKNLKKVVRKLIQFSHKLRSKKSRTNVPEEIREPLAQAADEVQEDVRELKDSLICGVST